MPQPNPGQTAGWGEYSYNAEVIMAQIQLVASNGDFDTSDGVPEPQQEELTFDDFWLLYPRHVAKKDARRAWDKIADETKIEVVVALVDWRPVWAEKAAREPDAEDHIPHPATWLNGERWEDELPKKYAGKRSASHSPAQLPEQGAREAMPEKVRALLASLRARK